MTPIRPEKPEDFDDPMSGPGGASGDLLRDAAAETTAAGSTPAPGRALEFRGLDKIMEDYFVPSVIKHVGETAMSDRLFETCFGRPRSQLHPDFWLWRDLDRVPTESDQCPWV